MNSRLFSLSILSYCFFLSCNILANSPYEKALDFYYQKKWGHARNLLRKDDNKDTQKHITLQHLLNLESSKKTQYNIISEKNTPDLYKPYVI